MHCVVFQRETAIEHYTVTRDRHHNFNLSLIGMFLILLSLTLSLPAQEVAEQIIEIRPTLAGSLASGRRGFDTPKLKLHYFGEPPRRHLAWMKFALPEIGADRVIRKMTLNVGPVKDSGAYTYNYCGFSAWFFPDAAWTEKTITESYYPRDYQHWVKLRYHASRLTPTRVFSNDISSWLDAAFGCGGKPFSILVTGHARGTSIGCTIEKVTINLHVTERGSLDVKTKEGKAPLTAIVIPDEPLRLLRYSGQVSGYFDQKCAARILQQHLVNATGAFLPIVPAAKMPADGKVILVGDSAASRRFGLSPPKESEGFRIKSFDRGIAIIGEISDGKERQDAAATDRGVLWGIYEFLERFLNCRFYFDKTTFFPAGGDSVPFTGELVPQRLQVTLPAEMDVSDHPFFSLRMCGDYRGYRGSSATGFYANHTHFLWDRYYAKTHPEYFWMDRNGKRHPGNLLCYSEPGVLKQTVQNIEEFYKTGRWIGDNRPRGKYILFEPADNQPQCFCEPCQSQIPKDAHKWSKCSNVHWSFVNKLAREIKKRWPEKRLATLAYQAHTEPPDFPIEDNVDVQVCLMVATTRSPNKWMMDTIRTWHERLGRDCNRLFIWDYYCYPAYWTAASLIYPRTMKEFVQTVKPMVSGIYFSRGGHTPQQSHFMQWVTMKLLWNPDWDVDDLLDRYCRRFFGPASAPIRQFYELCIERYEKLQKSGKIGEHYVHPSLLYGPDCYSPKVIGQLKKHLSQAQAAVEGLPPSNFFRRAVDWMRSGMLDYNRAASMYTTQYGFLAEAEQFQKWHRRTSQYKVTKIDVTPGTDLTGEPWKTAAVTRLVFGSERPRFSFYNMGWDADLATEIRVLHDDENLYVAFDSEEPVLDAALNEGDRVGVKLYLGVKCVTSVFCNPEGEVFSDAPNVKVKIVESKGRWQAFLTIPKASCKIPLKGNVRALFFRTRQARGDSPENQYIWSPRLGHWSDHPAHRLGVLIF